MRKLTSIVLASSLAFFATSLSASEKEGFLTKKWCAENGLFADCKLEAVVCGYEGCYKDWNPGDPKKTDDYVLYVHNEQKIYEIDISSLKLSELDEGMNRNKVTIVGDIDESSGKIVATSMKAPPPPEKSFFKGCL